MSNYIDKEHTFRSVGPFPGAGDSMSVEYLLLVQHEDTKRLLKD